jgi:Na+-transporting NADH:ubiquinone oxidoreductase subunit NqrB
MEELDIRRLLLVATVTALCATALVAIMALLIGGFDDTQLRILATTGGFGLVSLIATRGTALLDQGRNEALARSVLALSALAFVVEVWVIWIDTDSEAAWKSFVCAIAAAGATGQIAGTIARRRPTDPPSLTPLIWAAGACAVILAFMACFAALAEVDEAGYYQLFGAIAVLNILGVLLQPVIRRLGRPAPVDRGAPDMRPGRFIVVLADGRRVEHEPGSDLPNAIASALRTHGERVSRIELGDG